MASDTATAMAHAGRRAGFLSGDRISLQDPHVLFLKFVTVYVVLLSLSAALGTGLFRAFSYVIALLMLFVLAVRSAGRESGGLGRMEYIFPLLLYYYGLVGSIAFNYQALDWPVAIKLMLAPFFFLIGARIEAQRLTKAEISRQTWLMFGIVALLPVAILALQLIKGANVFGRGADFSIFANRNNAGLYAVALLGLFSVYSRKTPTNVVIYMVVGASFGTLGVLLAIIFSLMLMVVKRENLIRYVAGLFLAGVAITVLAINDVWIFARLKPVIGTLQLLVDPRVHLPTMTYERLYYALGTTDLSLAFRIKHWYDLADIFTSASVFNWFLGLGVGSSAKLSQAVIVPHNDYLRMLFECGIVTFAGFVSLISVMLIKLGRRWEAVPFLAIALYMLSENLIDNFLAMSIFYYAGGVLVYRRQTANPQKAIRPVAVDQLRTSNADNV